MLNCIKCQYSKSQHHKNGKYIGEHITYWENGKKSKVAQFKDGFQHGDYIEWYTNGKVYTYTLYEMGVVKGHKVWRKNGRIYANYIHKNGQNIGLSGGKLCVNAKDLPKSNKEDESKEDESKEKER